MSLVVSDTSPIRALHHLGLLELLPKLFGQIMVPPAVAEELRAIRARFHPIDIAGITHFSIVIPGNVQQVSTLKSELDPGEAEAISLALERHALLLIDEAAGRRRASALGVRTTGVIGVLIEAKNAGHIAQVMPALQRLREELGFYLSEDLLKKVRELCNE